MAENPLATRKAQGVAAPTNTVVGWLKANKDELTRDCPGGSQSVERVIVTLSQLGMSDDYAANRVKACTPESIYGALKECLLRGLHLGGQSGMGHAALTPYKGVCKLDINYQGLLHEARKSGSYKSIFAKEVHSGDSFRVWTDETGEHFEHIEEMGKSRTDATMEYVYAVAVEKSGAIRFEYMSKDEIDYVEKTTRKKDMSSPWKLWYREMAKKTVLKRLGKMLDRVPELSSAMDVDNLQFKDAPLQAQPVMLDTKTGATLPSNNRIEGMLGGQL